MSRTLRAAVTTDIWILSTSTQGAFRRGRGIGQWSTHQPWPPPWRPGPQPRPPGRLIANDARGTFLRPHGLLRRDRLILDYLASLGPTGTHRFPKTLAWDRMRRLPRRAIAVITPSADPGWVRLLQAVRAEGDADRLLPRCGQLAARR
jgi:hypothetical protein